MDEGGLFGIFVGASHELNDRFGAGSRTAAIGRTRLFDERLSATRSGRSLPAEAAAQLRLAPLAEAGADWPHKGNARDSLERLDRASRSESASCEGPSRGLNSLAAAHVPRLVVRYRCRSALEARPDGSHLYLHDEPIPASSEDKAARGSSTTQFGAFASTRDCCLKQRPNASRRSSAWRLSASAPSWRRSTTTCSVPHTEAHAGISPGLAEPR